MNLFLAAAIVFSGTLAVAQDSSYITVTQLNDHLYRFNAKMSRYTVNMLASVGADGLLLVDAGQSLYSEELKGKVEALGFGAPKIIINTHAHVDHTGGNAIFGAEPIIIAHETVRTRLRSDEYVFEEFPEEALPEIGFTDSLSLHFNGDEIRLTAFPGSHDNNDIIVHFVESKIVCLGDISCGLAYPSVDYGRGNTMLYAEIVGQLIDYLPPDVLLLPGHGEPFDHADLIRFQQMLAETAEIVRKEFAQGKDTQAMMKENVLAEYDAWANGGYTVDAEEWIRSLVYGLEEHEQKKAIYAPLYLALQESGTEAAVAKYYDIKNNYADEYQVSSGDLWYVGCKLNDKERYTEAIVFIELSVKEYPDDESLYMAYYCLGVAHNGLGQKGLARQDAEKALELKPGNSHATTLLEEIDKD